MNILSHQKGTGHIVALFGVLVIAVAGFAGYRVIQSNNPEAVSDAAIHATKTPTKLKTSADAKKAANSLDDTTIDSSINPNQLDDDLNSVL